MIEIMIGEREQKKVVKFVYQIDRQNWRSEKGDDRGEKVVFVDCLID